jgi:hypothetical protein
VAMAVVQCNIGAFTGLGIGFGYASNMLPSWTYLLVYPIYAGGLWVVQLVLKGRREQEARKQIEDEKLEKLMEDQIEQLARQQSPARARGPKTQGGRPAGSPRARDVQAVHHVDH